MKFVHTADLHIGANRASIPGYLLRQEEMLDSIYDVAYDNNIDTVVVAGDIFHDPDTTTTEERNMVKRKLLEYDSAGFRTLMIPGNHDLINATGITEIHYLALLSSHGRLKFSVITESTTYVPIGDTVFCLLCHRKHKFKEDLQLAVEDFKSSSLLLPYKNFVVVGHETIRGSATDVKLKDGSFYKLKDGADAPDTSLPVTYFAMGDIHKHQAISKNAYYSGSPVQTTFKDGWPKGVLLVDTEDPTNPKFVPVQSNPLIDVKDSSMLATLPSNAYVKLRFSSKDEIPQDLPDNVVKVIVESSSSLSLDLTSDSDLRDRLLQGVKQQGASKEDMQLAEVELDSLLELATLNEATDGF